MNLQELDSKHSTARYYFRRLIGEARITISIHDLLSVFQLYKDEDGNERLRSPPIQLFLKWLKEQTGLIPDNEIDATAQLQTIQKKEGV